MSSLLPPMSAPQDNHTLLTTSPLSSAPPGRWGGEGCPSGARRVARRATGSRLLVGRVVPLPLHAPPTGRYAFCNMLEALAAGSGAFYVNDTERAVYCAPLPGEDMAALEVRLSEGWGTPRGAPP